MKIGEGARPVEKMKAWAGSLASSTVWQCLCVPGAVQLLAI